MRARNRGFSRGRIGAPREPVAWSRTPVELTATNAKDTSVATTLFQPRNVNFGALDVRTTIMRLHAMLWTPFVFAGGSVVAGDVMTVYAGIAMVDDTASALNPDLSTSADEDADWLWLGEVATIATGANFTFLPNWTSNPLNFPGGIDVRSKRKLNNGQLLALYLKAKGSSIDLGHSSSTVTVSSRSQVSALWQRTMRRR